MKRSSLIREILSFIITLLAASLGTYIAIISKYWIALSVPLYSLTVLSMKFCLFFDRDDNKYALKNVTSIINFVSIFVLVFGLLFMMFIRPQGDYVSLWMIISLFAVGAMQSIELAIMKFGNLHNTLIAAILVSESIFNYYFATILLGDFILKESRNLIFLIVLFVLNFLLTGVTVIYSLSALIQIKEKNVMVIKHQGKAFFAWVRKYEGTMFLTLTFLSFLAIAAFVQVKNNILALSLGFFYVGIILLRLTAYFIHRKIQSKYQGNDKMIKRRTGKMMLFISIFLIVAMNFYWVLAIYFWQSGSTQASDQINVFSIIGLVFFTYKLISAIINMNTKRKDEDYNYFNTVIDAMFSALSILSSAFILLNYIDALWVIAIAVFLMVIVFFYENYLCIKLFSTSIKRMRNR